MTLVGLPETVLGKTINELLDGSLANLSVIEPKLFLSE